MVSSGHEAAALSCSLLFVFLLPHCHCRYNCCPSLLLEYDFVRNPLGIDDVLLQHIHTQSEEFKALHLADSFTVDFHKVRQ